MVLKGDRLLIITDRNDGQNFNKSNFNQLLYELCLNKILTVVSAIDFSFIPS